MKLIGKHKLYKHQNCFLAKQPGWDIVMMDLNGAAYIPAIDFKRSMISSGDIALAMVRPSAEKQWRG